MSGSIKPNMGGPIRAVSDNVLASPRFVDRAPAEVVATLLDEGHYLCSERTMVRLLAAEQSVRERRNQRTRPPYCPSPNSSPPGRTRLGRGTSPACSDRSAGRTSTSTCCSISSAATSWGGWSPSARTPLLPRHAHRADLREAGHRAPGAYPALRPRRSDDQPVLGQVEVDAKRNEIPAVRELSISLDLAGRHRTHVSRLAFRQRKIPSRHLVAGNRLRPPYSPTRWHV